MFFQNIRRNNTFLQMLKQRRRVTARECKTEPSNSDKRICKNNEFYDVLSKYSTSQIRPSILV